MKAANLATEPQPKGGFSMKTYPRRVETVVVQSTLRPPNLGTYSPPPAYQVTHLPPQPNTLCAPSSEKSPKDNSAQHES